MKNLKLKLLSILIAISMIFGVTLDTTDAAWKYNPFTGKQDYYEPVGAGTLGGLGDVTLTSIAGGAILIRNTGNTAWINLPIGTAGQRLEVSSGLPSWQTVSSTFLGLTDTPANFTGSNSYMVRVNSGATALEFGAEGDIDHDGLTNWAANKHVVLPGTLANVLTDHNLLAHTTLGLFDASSDVDHDQTTNWVGNKHIDWTNTTQNLSTEGSASLNDAGATGETGLNLYSVNSTFSTIAQSDAEGVASKSDLRIGVDETLRGIIIADRGDIATDFGHGAPAHPTIYLYNADATTRTTIYDGAFLTNSAGLNFTSSGTIDTGADAITRFTLNADVAAGNAFLIGTWDDGSELTDSDAEQAWLKIYAEINQTDTASYVGLLVDVKEQNTGSGDKELLALRVGGSDKFIVDNTGKMVGGAAQFTGDVDFTEDITATWADAADHLHFTQSAEFGIENQALVKIQDDREDATTDEPSESSLAIYAAGDNAFYVAAGQSTFGGDTLFQDDVEFYEDFSITWAQAADHAVIHQASASGIEDQPLILIDDDRTGVTVDEDGEASLVISGPSGLTALYISQGYLVTGAASRTYLGGRVYFQQSDNAVQSDKDLSWGTAFQHKLMWDTNGAGDDLMTYRSITSATQTAAIFYSNNTLAATAMTDHDNYLSPTFILANNQGADANDYSGVVIGERVQADVAIAHYFDFYAMVGAADGAVDPTTTELAAIFRFGASGSATPTYATTPGDVLFEGAIEILGEFNLIMDQATDEVIIHQTAVAGTEDQPLIYINDDRVGVTVNEKSEATIYIETAANRAILITGGYGIELDGGSGLTSSGEIYAEGHFWWSTHWDSIYDSNSTEDEFLTFRYTGYGANDTSAIFWSKLDPVGTPDFNDWESPTFVITNTEGADTNDYAGVVIGERAQANVAIAHYFDFYAMTGSSDAAVDGTTAELAAIFRFGASGTATPTYATTPGDVLFEGAIEVLGNLSVLRNAATARVLFLQEAEAGTEDQPFVWIDDAREGATVDEYLEASLRINAEGYGLAVLGKSHFGDGTNYASFAADGELTLAGTARVDKTMTVNFQHAIVSAQGKPTTAVLGANSGFSLPIYAADNEELFSCKSLPLDMDPTVDLVAYIGCYLDTANNAKKFRLQVSWTIDDLSGNDVLAAGTTDVPVQTVTGDVAQYTSYKIPFTIASVAASAVAGNKIGFRVRRLAADDNEIAGEVVVCGMALKYRSAKLGAGT